MRLHEYPLKCICGLLNPTSGKVTVNGKIIGKDCDFIEDADIMIEHTGFIKSQSGYRNLYNLAMVKKQISKDDIMHTLKLVGLEDAAHKAVRTYSMGMRQRLALKQSWKIHPLLFLTSHLMVLTEMEFSK